VEETTGIISYRRLRRGLDKPTARRTVGLRCSLYI